MKLTSTSAFKRILAYVYNYYSSGCNNIIEQKTAVLLLLGERIEKEQNKIIMIRNGSIVESYNKKKPNIFEYI